MKDLIDSWLLGEPGVRLTANPETILGDKPATPVIDLRQRIDVCMNYRPWLRADQYECFDRETFDADPDSRWHIFGRGETSGEAVKDMLKQIAIERAKS